MLRFSQTSLAPASPVLSNGSCSTQALDGFGGTVLKRKASSLWPYFLFEPLHSSGLGGLCPDGSKPGCVVETEVDHL